MLDIKDELKKLASDIDDLITEVEDSDEYNEDIRAELIDALEDALSLINEAKMAV